MAVGLSAVRKFNFLVTQGIICDTLSSKKKTPIDSQIYYYRQCFVGLWLNECLNDIYCGFVIIKGDDFGPLLCRKQVDMFGKECLEAGKYTYMYKNEAEIPPLSMVNDGICMFIRMRV